MNLLKSYTTCVFGINFIGWTNIVTGSCGTIFSILFGSIAKYIEQPILVVFMLMLSISNMVLMLYWMPNPNSLYVVFVMAIAFGINKAYYVGQLRGIVICFLYLLFIKCLF